MKHLVNMFLTLLVDNAFLKPIHLEETISLPIKCSCVKLHFLMRQPTHSFAVATHLGWPLINNAHYTRYARLMQWANQVQKRKRNYQRLHCSYLTYLYNNFASFAEFSFEKHAPLDSKAISIFLNAKAYFLSLKPSFF